jgi:hypothetical protein
MDSSPSVVRIAAGVSLWLLAVAGAVVALALEGIRQQSDP